MVVDGGSGVVSCAKLSLKFSYVRKEIRSRIPAVSLSLSSCLLVYYRNCRDIHLTGFPLAEFSED